MAASPASGRSAVLSIDGLVKRYGRLTVLDHVSFALGHGARHALIGPNGAGKSTFADLISGLTPASGGTIVLDGRDISRLSAERRVKRGLVRAFAPGRLFESLTPVESLALAVAERRGETGRWWAKSGRRARAEVGEGIERSGLKDDMRTPVRRLSSGKRRRLELALALAAGPRMLVLDEPFAGVPEAERPQMLSALDAIPEDVAVLVIERDLEPVAGFAREVTVLAEGAILASGPPDAIAADPAVEALYRGEDDRE